MGPTIDFYYTPMSPWSFMGLERLLVIARRHGATVRFKPVELPRIFATTGYQPITQRPPALLANRMQELRRWRAFLGLEMNLEPKYFPVPDKLACLTIAAALEAGHDATDLTRALMRGCWVQERDISDPDTVAAIAGETGLDGAGLVAATNSEAVARRLDAHTDEAIAHQAIGVPTYVAGGEVFFGQDRLEFLDRQLAGRDAPPAYLIGHIRVKAPEQWQRYVAGVAASLAPFAGEIVVRGARQAILAGTTEHDRAVVIRFRDQATLRAWFESPAYQALIPLRDEAADVLIASFDAAD